MSGGPTKCKTCNVTMRVAMAIAPTWVGVPDFPGDKNPTTLSPGPGRLVRCLKCPSCGYSVIPAAPEESKPVAP